MPDSASYSYRAWGETDTGRLREANEDAYLCLPEEGIFVVIDGVGGEAGGEVAAAEAREVIRRRLLHRTGVPEVRLREAVTNANSKIYLRSREEPALAGMACVLTAVVIVEGQVVAAHVGDTRLYKIQDGRIEKLTRDHSLVGVREDHQELTEYEAMHHPRRNEILRDVGSELHDPYDDNFIDVVEAAFEPDSALLLCTDGLTDLVPSRDLLRAAYEHAGNPKVTVEALIQAANDAGGKDNITVIVVEGTYFGDEDPVAAARFDAAGEDDLRTRGTDTFSVSTLLPEPPVEPSAPQASDEHSAGRSRSPWLYYFLGVATVLVLLGAAYAVDRFGPAELAFWRMPAPTPDQEGQPPSLGEQPVTISELLAEAAPGDTLQIAPGAYRELVSLQSALLLLSDSLGHVRLVPPADTLPVRAVWGVEPALLDVLLEPDRAAGATGADSSAVGLNVRIRRTSAVPLDAEDPQADSTSAERDEGVDL